MESKTKEVIKKISVNNKKEEAQQILFQQLMEIAEKNKTCEPQYLKDNIQAMLNIYTILFPDYPYQFFPEYDLRS